MQLGHAVRVFVQFVGHHIRVARDAGGYDAAVRKCAGVAKQLHFARDYLMAILGSIVAIAILGTREPGGIPVAYGSVNKRVGANKRVPVGRQILPGNNHIFRKVSCLA